MNREILFRGKRVDNEEWVYGWLFQMKYDAKKYLIRTFPDKDDNYEDYVVIPETIGQYTGANDKNDKKIFENDILRNQRYQNGRPYGSLYKTVCWNDTRFNISGRAKQWEVIGTIHDKEDK